MFTYDVSGSPEQHGSSTSGGEVTVEEGQVGDSLLRPNVADRSVMLNRSVLKNGHSRKRTLVGVVEGSELGGSVQLLGQSLDFSLVGSGVGLQLLELSLKLVLLSELAEHLGKVDTLLRGDLGSGGVLSSGAVSHGVSSLSSEQSKVVVNKQTSSLSLCVGKLAHQVSGDLSGSVTGGPDKKTVGDLLHLLVGVLDDNAGRLDILNHGSGENVNLVGSELVLSVLDELLGEGGKDVGESLDQGDLQSVGDLRVPLLQVVLQGQHDP
jgi:hypothetical protein